MGSSGCGESWDNRKCFPSVVASVNTAIDQSRSSGGKSQRLNLRVSLCYSCADAWAVSLASWVEALHVRDSSKSQIGVQKYKTKNHCGEKQAERNTQKTNRTGEM